MPRPVPRRVVIVQRYVTHYRVAFFEQLRRALADAGIELSVVHGPAVDAHPWERAHLTSLPWSEEVTNHFISVGHRWVLWQPALRHVRGADLVIVEQASANLLNYVLFALQFVGRTRLAFWGHGRNMKTDKASGLGEAIKRFMSRKVHWWFAYNTLSAGVVRDLGYPVDRVTDVQNAIDTRMLRDARAALAPADIDAVRADLGLPVRNVGIFVGGMYEEKRLDFLIEAAEHVRALVPAFHLVLIGGGADEEIAARAADRFDWVHYLGPLIGDEKVPVMAAADLFLMPGLVGLAVIDAFALELPLITVEFGAHSPEIAYLDSGRNGLMCPVDTSPADYGKEVARLLQDDAARAALVQGCRESASRYTVEAMVDRYAGGVRAALTAPRRR